MGRSRLLDAFALEAKLLGAVALRAGASSAQVEPLAVARSLAEQLIEALPETALLGGAPRRRRTDRCSSGRPSRCRAAAATRLALRAFPSAGCAVEQQHALVQWLLLVTAKHALCVVVDDVDRVDEPSAALLAALALSAAHKRMLLCRRLRAARAPRRFRARPARARVPHARAAPARAHETEALLGSLFGDVPNLALLSERIHASAGGRPRECMALAQHLVETSAIVYAGGGWTLPERFAPSDLPEQRAGRVSRAHRDARCGGAAARTRPGARGVRWLRADDYALLAPAARQARSTPRSTN